MSEVGTAAFTAEEHTQRLERWQALLSGQGLQAAQQAHARRLRKQGPVNLMTGVLLHAAARADQGLELTELERSVLAPLERVLGTDHLHAMGRIYHQQLSGGRSAEIVPTSVSSRPLQQGFDEQAYKAAFAEMLPLVATMPNLAVVNRAHLTDGQGFDSAEFTAALAEHGFGVTGFSGADDETADPAARAPFHAKLEMQSFFCHKAVGDQGGGRDEIYWTAAANATDFERTLRTNETGSVTEGKEFLITGDKVFFDTRLDGCGSAAITVWEADDSGDRWYTALGNALRDIVETLKYHDLFLSVIPGMDLYGHLYSALSLFATIIEHLRNKDDMVLTRAFAFGRADLAALYHYNDSHRMPWEFDRTSQGMGRFSLIVRYTGENPGHPASGDGSLISNGWRGLYGTVFVRDLAAACNLPDAGGEIYFFKDDQYLRYDVDTESIVGGPGNTGGGWPALKGTVFAEGIDAACSVPGAEHDVYLFRGDRYVNYDIRQEEHGGVNSIHASWPGLRGTIFTSDLDAACQSYMSSHVYLFKGDQVAYYNTDTESLRACMRISDAFPAVAGTSFASGLSAACMVPSELFQYYLFQGDRYVRVYGKPIF
ncbi:hypothetical protein FE391_39410 [Nonomuraea sp. KC401]|uniref:hemopexin repeat-containing protein n=1 Tax=unclassified Nonomuraea TaxID=2593643 RepID=UPI0010FCED15|nr:MULTISPECIES: hemopexin repeat-containing protein [unclassified Nonomuraea]NBE99612.1 hypothetical protein [Nonomuraea sp. K271]TLF56420.1 hypothetical protein FE391_39410 [Nonomuraea sp. KC401]